MYRFLEGLSTHTLKSLTMGSLFCLFIGGSATRAQTFNTAFLPEYPYPVPGTVIPGGFPNPVNITNHTFTYTMGHIAYMTPAVAPPSPPPGGPYMPAPPPPPPPSPSWLSDLELHSWGHPNSTAGLAWVNRATGSGLPGTIYDQGFMMYPIGVQNIEMSLMQDKMGVNMFIWGTNAPWIVVVSFYNGNPANYTGVGHYLEYYRWNNPIPVGTGGLTFMGRVQLSAINTYTRISHDAHNTYGFVVAWEDPNPGPTNGINCRLGFMDMAVAGVSLSPNYVLAGTGGQTFPDVAFTHASGGIKYQFVYHNVVPGGVNITESEIPFTIPPYPVVLPAPAVNDISFNGIGGVLPARLDIKTHLDAPDHYNQDNWAYAYLLPGVAPNDVFVRYRNFNLPNLGVPATYNLTSGIMGNVPCTNNNWPTLSFDATPSRINVGWYTMHNPPGPPQFYFPNIGGYVDLQMDETGVITSPLDYMQVGLSTTASNRNASTSPHISYSKQNDRTDYHFCVFANQLCPSNASEIQTKERIWTNAAFKGGEAPAYWEEFYGTTGKDAPVSTMGIATKDNIVAYPNPFSTELSLSIPAGMQGKKIEVTVLDIAGKELDQYTGASNEINGFLTRVAKTLSNGTYLINLATEAGSVKKTLKVQKLATE